MSLFLRCDWIPSAEVDLEARRGAIAAAVADSALVRALGPHWYRRGRSRKEALKHELALSALATAGAWRTVSLGDAGVYYAWGAWNGGDATLDLAMCEPPEQRDQIVVEAELEKLGALLAWPDLVADATLLSDRLGARCVIGSVDAPDDGVLVRLEPGRAPSATYSTWDDFRRAIGS